MQRRPVIAIGASAGGVEALVELARGLKPSVDAAILVVLHVSPTGYSVLPSILERASGLPARHCRNSDPLVPGTILVAPPGWHLRVNDGHAGLDPGPTVNGHRPSIDVLFRSVADAAGSDGVGVILSGLLDDGADGGHRIEECGGRVVVQDPEDALFPSMPMSALERLETPVILPAAEIGRELQRMASDMRDIPADERPSGDGAMDVGRPSDLGCPACGGVLREVNDARGLTFVCRVGHAYSAQSLLDDQSRRTEEALWSAIRNLEERAELMERLASQFDPGGGRQGRRHLDRRSSQLREDADALRELQGRLAQHNAPLSEAETG